MIPLSILLSGIAKVAIYDTHYVIELSPKVQTMFNERPKTILLLYLDDKEKNHCFHKVLSLGIFFSFFIVFLRI